MSSALLLNKELLPYIVMSSEIQQIIQDIEESLDKNKWNIDHITVNNNTIIISLQHTPSSAEFSFKLKIPEQKEPKNNFI